MYRQRLFILAAFLGFNFTVASTTCEGNGISTCIRIQAESEEGSNYFILPISEVQPGVSQKRRVIKFGPFPLSLKEGVQQDYNLYINFPVEKKVLKWWARNLEVVLVEAGEGKSAIAKIEIKKGSEGSVLHKYIRLPEDKQSKSQDDTHYENLSAGNEYYSLNIPRLLFELVEMLRTGSNEVYDTPKNIPGIKFPGASSNFSGELTAIYEEIEDGEVPYEFKEVNTAYSESRETVKKKRVINKYDFVNNVLFWNNDFIYPVTGLPDECIPQWNLKWVTFYNQERGDEDTTFSSYLIRWPGIPQRGLYIGPIFLKSDGGKETIRLPDGEYCGSYYLFGIKLAEIDGVTFYVLSMTPYESSSLIHSSILDSVPDIQLFLKSYARESEDGAYIRWREYKYPVQTGIIPRTGWTSDCVSFMDIMSSLNAFGIINSMAKWLNKLSSSYSKFKTESSDEGNDDSSDKELSDILQGISLDDQNKESGSLKVFFRGGFCDGDVVTGGYYEPLDSSYVVMPEKYPYKRLDEIFPGSAIWVSPDQEKGVIAGPFPKSIGGDELCYCSYHFFRVNRCHFKVKVIITKKTRETENFLDCLCLFPSYIDGLHPSLAEIDLFLDENSNFKVLYEYFGRKYETVLGKANFDQSCTHGNLLMLEKLDDKVPVIYPDINQCIQLLDALINKRPPQEIESMLTRDLFLENRRAKFLGEIYSKTASSDKTGQKRITHKSVAGPGRLNEYQSSNLCNLFSRCLKPAAKAVLSVGWLALLVRQQLIAQPVEDGDVCEINQTYWPQSARHEVWGK